MILSSADRGCRQPNHPGALGYCPSIRAILIRPPTATLQTQKPLRISSQDTLEIAGWQFQLFDERVRVFDIPRGEEIRADHDTVRPDLANQEAQRFGIVIEIVVMESPDILFEWMLHLQLNGAHVIEAVLDACEDERKCASAMWQDD